MITRYQIGLGGYVNKLFSILLLPGGRIGVAIFFLIMGFYQIEKKSISVKKVCIETVFYSVLISITFYIMGYGSIGGLVRSFFPLSSNTWWFASIYFIIMMCSVSINGIFKSKCKKDRMIILLCAWLGLYMLPYILKLSYYNLMRGVFFYLIGAYIRIEYKSIHQVKHRKIILLIAILSFLIYLPVGYYYYSNAGQKGDLLNIVLDGLIYNGVLVPGCAILLFLYAISCKKFYSTIINSLASSTYAIYLIHDNPNRYIIWDEIFHVIDSYKSSYFVLYVFLMVIIIFGFGHLIDVLRRYLFVMINKKCWH